MYEKYHYFYKISEVIKSETPDEVERKILAGKVNPKLKFYNFFNISVVKGRKSSPRKRLFSLNTPLAFWKILTIFQMLIVDFKCNRAFWSIETFRLCYTLISVK